MISSRAPTELHDTTNLIVRPDGVGVGVGVGVDVGGDGGRVATMGTGMDDFAGTVFSRSRLSSMRRRRLGLSCWTIMGSITVDCCSCCTTCCSIESDGCDGGKGSVNAGGVGSGSALNG